MTRRLMLLALAALLAPLGLDAQPYPNRPVKIIVGGAAFVKTAIDRVIKKFRDQRVSTIDGVRIDLTGADNGWVHFRASNTEPIVRLIAEAKTDSRAWELIDEVAAAAGLK